MSKEYIYIDCNHTQVAVLDKTTYSVENLKDSDVDSFITTIGFQQGNPETVGVNGLSTDVLLAVLIHRTIQELDGNFNPDIDSALRHMKLALSAVKESKVV